MDELRALGADAAVAEAVAALNAAFPGIVSPQGRIGAVAAEKAGEFLGLKGKADMAQSRADAVDARLSHLANRIEQEQKTGAFFANAPRTLAVLKALQDAMVSKEVLYPEAFEPVVQPGPVMMGYGYQQPKQFNSRRGHLPQNALQSESLGCFTIGAMKGRSPSNLYVDFNFSSFGPSVPGEIRAQLATIIGDNPQRAQDEINAWLSAFPEYLDDARFAVAGAKSLAKATDAKMSSLISNVSASVSDLDAATTDARVFSKTQTEEGKKVSALGAVKKWLDEVADHLRKNGFVS